MKFMGSKSRVTKYIIPIIQKQIDDNNVKTYIEPFVGGANVIDKIRCENRVGTDSNSYLIALLKEVQKGNKLLDEVSRKLYNEVREIYHNNDLSKYKDWEIGCIGFLASYNGRFFEGGYAKSGYEKTKNGSRYRDYYKESKANILRQYDDIQGIIFDVKDYREYTQLHNCCIYCDPPYKNTKQYANALNFNYNEFWDVMRKWSENNIVIISEQEAPDDFQCIWEKTVNRSIKATDKSYSTEKLFMLK